MSSGECVVVGTFAFWLLVGFGCERYVFGHDSLDLLLHFLDLRTGEVGDAEVVILFEVGTPRSRGGGQSARLCCGT